MKIECDLDPTETQERIDALRSVVAVQEGERTNYHVGKLVDVARRDGAYIRHLLNTAYINTILSEKEERSPSDRGIERKIRSIVRWMGFLNPACGALVRSSYHADHQAHTAGMT